MWLHVRPSARGSRWRPRSTIDPRSMPQSRSDELVLPTDRLARSFDPNMASLLMIVFRGGPHLRKHILRIAQGLDYELLRVHKSQM